MRWAGPGPKILGFCDGQRNVAQIVRELQGLYPSAPAARIEEEVKAFLERLQAKSVLDF